MAFRVYAATLDDAAAQARRVMAELRDRAGLEQRQIVAELSLIPPITGAAG